MDEKDIKAAIEHCNLEPVADLDERYDEMLDECCEMVRIGSLEYLPSQTLSSVDPIAYRCGYSDWLDAECQDDRLVYCDGEYYDYEQVQDAICELHEDKEHDLD